MASVNRDKIRAFTQEELDGMSRDELEESLMLLEELDQRARRRAIWKYYPEDGLLSRHNYPKHIAFLNAGAKYRERLLISANRIGKTEGIGGYEVTLHLIGIYPDWWEGKRFKRAVRVVVAGDTAKTTRDIIQAKMFGPSGREGEGLIPGHTIVRTTKKPGTPDAIDQAWVRHKSGQPSLLTFKSYDQGRVAFQGNEQEVIWLDEEPPLSVYSECVMRTMTTQGLIIMTFTPLMGVTEVVKLFMPDGTLSSAMNVG